MSPAAAKLFDELTVEMTAPLKVLKRNDIIKIIVYYDKHK